MRTYISMIAILVALVLNGCSRNSAPVPVKPPPAGGVKVDAPTATQPDRQPAPNDPAKVGDQRITFPNYEPGQVWFTAVTAKGANCQLTTAPAAPGTGTTFPLLAHWGGYEWSRSAWGTVTFGKDAQGRTVIATLAIADTCESGV